MSPTGEASFEKKIDMRIQKSLIYRCQEVVGLRNDPVRNVMLEMLC